MYEPVIEGYSVYYCFTPKPEMWTCDLCGSLIYNKDRHTWWHSVLEKNYRKHDSELGMHRIIGRE